jgi:outer membrane protein assembly factor BamB
VQSSPAIGSDGTVYFGSDDGRLYAINGQSGVKLWEFKTEGKLSPSSTGISSTVQSSPAIGSDGTVYFGLKESLLLPIKDPQLIKQGMLWRRTESNKLYALNGKSWVKLWEFKTEDPVHSPAIGSDGTVYVGSYDDKLYAINGKSGVKLWEFKMGYINDNPVIGSDGTVYVGSTNEKSESDAKGKLYALNGKTRLKNWEFTTEKSTFGSLSSPAIGSDGTVYVGSSDRKLYAINGKSGVKLWEFKTGNLTRSSPAIGSDGTVYVGSWDNKLYAIDGNKLDEFYVNGIKHLRPTKLWEFETGGPVGSSPAIGSDGTVYVGSDDGKLYAIKTDSKGLANSPWPMHRQNPLHTGRTK